MVCSWLVFKIPSLFLAGHWSSAEELKGQHTNNPSHYQGRTRPWPQELGSMETEKRGAQESNLFGYCQTSCQEEPSVCSQHGRQR